MRVLLLLFAALYPAQCLAVTIDYACTKSPKVNFRNGPGQNFEVVYIVQKLGYPIQIVAKSDAWYAIKSFDGDAAWVRQDRITWKDCGVVARNPSSGGAYVPFFARPNDSSRPIYMLSPGYIAYKPKCYSSLWCNVKVGDTMGWVRYSEIWGYSE